MTEHHAPIAVGRYLLHRTIARGGMATIHIARLLGDVGFSRIVAAKRMHPELAEDAELVAMFLDEARLASRVQHPNVVNVLDVVTLGSEVMLVQEYVHGAALSALVRAASAAKAHIPVPVAVAIARQILAGLHAAHETTDELGTPLHIVHRDVSPQNILIAVDGNARLVDFGVAKAALTAHVSRKDTFKGKLAYSPPEQIRGNAVRQSDVYALGVVLWELLVGHRLHDTAQGEAQLIATIMDGRIPTITEALSDERAWIGPYRWGQLVALEPIVRKALDTSVRHRWATAAEMEEALAAAVPVAPPADVAAWLRAVGKPILDERERLIAEEEASWRRNGAQLAAEISVASISPAPPPARRRRQMPGALIAMMFVAVAVGVTVLARDLDRSVDPSPMAMPTAETPAPTPAPTTPAPTTPAPAPPPPAQAPPPRPETTSAPARSSRARPARRIPARAKPPAPSDSAATSRAALDCETPFYFEGRKKIFKPECL